MAETVKNPPVNERDKGSISGEEDPLEEGMATHSSILAWRIPTGRGAWRATVHGVAKSQTWLSDQAWQQNQEVALFITMNFSGFILERISHR